MIVLRYVTHYRVPFLEGLREELARRGIDFVLVSGSPDPGSAADSKEHTVELPWAVHVENRWVRIGSRRLLWQPALGALRSGDLVIVEQASSRLLNYVLLARQVLGRQRLGFWGHGRNFQAHRASPLGEAVKRVTSRRVHWWFAYNRRAAEVVEELGFPGERISDVQNAIDTQELVEARKRLTEADLAAARAELGISGEHVGVFIGGMYPEKRLPLLIEACELVRELVPDFEMIFIGKGRDLPLVDAAVAAHPWMHYAGVRTGTDRVPYLAAGSLLLMPGLVGLVVLDAFAVGVPLVTSGDCPHSPEIAYLEDGRNGVVVGGGAPVTPADYARAVAGLLTDEPARARLVAGCLEASERYTMAAMVGRFADGIEQALDR